MEIETQREKKEFNESTSYYEKKKTNYGRIFVRCFSAQLNNKTKL